MDNRKHNLIELLTHIDPAQLSYSEWVSVGMALHHEGHNASDWEVWSQNDTRFKPGECFKKWDGFNGGSMGQTVTGGTIVQLAKEHGWNPRADGGHELDWDATIGPKDDKVIVDKRWIEGKEIEEPANWDPISELSTYLETLFNADEHVGYVTDAWERDGKYFPTKGCWDRTAGQLIQELNRCKGDMGAVLGDYKPEVGAWIRFNPLDGQGIKNENVSDFRYALVESDKNDIEAQNAILRELELPIACLVFSGGKSIHAIVRIEAGNYEEYRKRVDYLYEVCKKNGLEIDNQNRNPSRLSRMPGVTRNGRKQFLVDTNIGKNTWKDWHEWIEGVNDNLPDPESIAAVWDDMPPLSPPLIYGLLRQGHKMLLAGPSKAGKSFALTQLCIAIAEGRKWWQWDCARGRVLYINLELDRPSCLHRFKDVYKALECEPQNIDKIDVWNLRGKAVPMDLLVPKLIRRAQKRNYIAVVIDPIYKVITGDENSAGEMAHFTNQFDKIATDLECAVIYCHHHSKGGQGHKKSMDRASGSGVFARDPDALLDMIELDLKGETKEQADGRSAWRLNGVLREFPGFDPVNLWFDYPIHALDTDGILEDTRIDGEPEPTKTPVERKAERIDQIMLAYNALKMNGDVTVKDIAEFIEQSERNTHRRIKECPDLYYEKGYVLQKQR